MPALTKPNSFACNLGKMFGAVLTSSDPVFRCSRASENWHRTQVDHVHHVPLFPPSCGRHARMTSLALGTHVVHRHDSWSGLLLFLRAPGSAPYRQTEPRSGSDTTWSCYENVLFSAWPHEPPRSFAFARSGLPVVHSRGRAFVGFTQVAPFLVGRHQRSSIRLTAPRRRGNGLNVSCHHNTALARTLRTGAIPLSKGHSVQKDKGCEQQSWR